MLEPVFSVNLGFCTVSLKNKNEKDIKVIETDTHAPPIPKVKVW